MITGALSQLFALSRGLPRPQGQPELPQPAGGADRHRGPDRLRPAVLQRHRLQVQHQDPDVPGGDLRQHARLQRARVLRGRRRVPRPRPGQVLVAAERLSSRSPCTTRSRQNKRRSLLLDRRLRRCSSSLRRLVVQLPARRAARSGIVDRRAWSRSASAFVSLLEAPTRSPWRMSRAVARRPGAATPASTTWSRASASPAGCPSPGSTSSTTRRPTPSPPAATPSTRPIAVTTGLLEKMNRVELEGVLAHELTPRQELRHPRLDAGRDDGRRRGDPGRPRPPDAVVESAAAATTATTDGHGGAARAARRARVRPAGARRRSSPGSCSSRSAAGASRWPTCPRVEMTRYPPGPHLRPGEAAGRPHGRPRRLSRATAHLWIEEPIGPDRGRGQARPGCNRLFNTHPPHRGAHRRPPGAVTATDRSALRGSHAVRSTFGEVAGEPGERRP